MFVTTSVSVLAFASRQLLHSRNNRSRNFGCNLRKPQAAQSKPDYQYCSSAWLLTFHAKNWAGVIPNAFSTESQVSLATTS
jgi:hypothetical protein